MNKDVIYIDVDDDITAIISKVKAANEKIVALVPPKRIGVLQSAVNLRLLKRAAEQVNKRLVLISNDSALHALAASASLPVAKNLQSKPEVPAAAAMKIDDGDDIIDGAELPVGDHAKQAGTGTDDTSEALAAAPVIDSAVLDSLPEDDAQQADKAAPAAAAPAKKKAKVPNFNSFRKKLLFGGLAGVAAIAFLVWAIVFAPHATVIVSAKTSDNPINVSVAAVEDAKNDVEEAKIAAVKAESADDKSVEFKATGSKNVGKTATGTVKFSHQSQTSEFVPEGTRLKSDSGLIFITDESVTVPQSTFGGPGCFPTACPGTAEVGVTADDKGAKYNAEDGSMSGAPGDLSAELTGPTSGGTDKIVKIVTASDIQTAKQQLVDEDNQTKKDELKDEFDGDVNVIGQSFNVSYENVESSPAVGEEADGGTANLSASVVYTMYAIETNELDSFIKDYVKQQFDKGDAQRVYASGADDAQFQEVKKTDDGASFTLIATAQVGPNLKESEIKQQSRGRQFGDIQNSIQSIQGVENVDVNFFPFWVSTVPDDLDKINVTFKVDDSQ